MSNLIDYIPAHVREYLETQDNTIQQGLEFIANLEGDESFIEADRQLEATEHTSRILRGFLYTRYKEMSDGRTFSAFLAKRGIARSTAYEYITEAQLYSSLPNAQACATVAQIGQVKARLLSSLPEDQVQAFLDGKPAFGVSLEDANAMTKDEFKEALREFQQSNSGELAKANKEIGRLTAKLEVTNNDLAEARDELSRKFSDLPFSPWVSAVREEATVHGDSAGRALAGLSLALEQVQKHTTKSLKGDALAEYRAAATQVYHQLIGVFNNAKQLIEEADGFLPKGVVEHFDVSLPLSEQELEARLAHRDRLAQNEDVLEQLRAKQRAAQKKRGKGRPTDKADVYGD